MDLYAERCRLYMLQNISEEAAVDFARACAPRVTRLLQKAMAGRMRAVSLADRSSVAWHSHAAQL